jgi:Cu2+-exporting ATPase
LTVFSQLFSTFNLYLNTRYGLPENRIGPLWAVNTIIIVIIEMVLLHAIRRRNAMKVIALGAVFLAAGGRPAALLAVADGVRDEAAAAVADLRALGLRLAVVSGDDRATTAAVAARLGIERAVPEAAPAGKRDLVAEMQAGGSRVVAVGDGINDAPVLSQADVGMAMGRGTDVTLESADAVLVRDDLRLVPEAVRLSRRAYRIIRQNLFWAFFYNAVAIPLAMAGLLHPIVAAAAMAVSSLFVVGNSLRIGRPGRRAPAGPG